VLRKTKETMRATIFLAADTGTSQGRPVSTKTHGTWRHCQTQVSSFCGANRLASASSSNGRRWIFSIRVPRWEPGPSQRLPARIRTGCKGFAFLTIHLNTSRPCPDPRHRSQRATYESGGRHCVGRYTASENGLFDHCDVVDRRAHIGPIAARPLHIMIGISIALPILRKC
jgi:hypothetical protein